MSAGSSGFPCQLEGARHESCTCHVDADGHVVYAPVVEYCVADDGRQVALDETTRIDCAQFKCVRVGSALHLEVQSIGECSLYRLTKTRG